MNTKLMKNLKKKKKGFTLIELIIVIAILAILAALALPKFGAVRDNANKSSDIALGKNIQTELSKLIAEGEIELPTSATADTATVAKSAAGAAAASLTDGNKVANAIDGNVQAKYNTAKGDSFTYSLDKDGNIHVYVTTGATGSTTNNEVYPDQTGIYAAN